MQFSDLPMPPPGDYINGSWSGTWVLTADGPVIVDEDGQPAPCDDSPRFDPLEIEPADALAGEFEANIWSWSPGYAEVQGSYFAPVCGQMFPTDPTEPVPGDPDGQPWYAPPWSIPPNRKPRQPGPELASAECGTPQRTWRPTMPRLITTALVALSLLLAGAALANPIACEREGTIDSDGDLVQLTFLGQCGIDNEYNTVIAQRLDDGEWTTLDGDWEAVGVEAAEGGSGVDDYTVYLQEDPCPRNGEVEYRLAFTWDDEPSSWYGDVVECTGIAADDDDAAADDDDDPAADDGGVQMGYPGLCSAAGSSAQALLVSLLAGLAIALRRRF